ncbi:hypothetical protein K6025_05205 [Ehrlichia sp. JZT12]
MMNFREVLSKLVWVCNDSVNVQEVDVRIDASDKWVHLFSGTGRDNDYHIVENETWGTFVDVLENLSDLIFQNCVNMSNNSASATASEAISKLDDDSEININNFAFGFVSGAVVTSLVFTSYFLLKSCLTRIREGRNKGDITSFLDESEKYLQPNSTLDNSKEVRVENIFPYV